MFNSDDDPPAHPLLGWRAIARAKDGKALTETQLSVFAEAVAKQPIFDRSPDYRLSEGVIEGLESADILARVSGEFTGDDDNSFWPPEKVGTIAATAEWRRVEFLYYELNRLRTFLKLCAEQGLSIEFLFYRETPTTLP